MHRKLLITAALALALTAGCSRADNDPAATIAPLTEAAAEDTTEAAYSGEDMRPEDTARPVDGSALRLHRAAIETFT